MRRLPIGCPMNAAISLLSKVDEAISGGSLSRRGEVLRHVTDLFIVGSTQCSEEDIALFDTVFTRLAAEIELAARVFLAVRLAPIPNAPPITIRALAFDDAIEVAGPVLAQSERLDDAALIENASTKGQEHLFAISRRRILSEAVTDVLVVRGDHQVALSTVENSGARFSEGGFARLVQRAEDDDRLAESVGLRPEIPPHLVLTLLDKASAAVRTKLEAVHPQAKTEVHEAVTEATERIRDDALERMRNHATALALAESLHRAGFLDDDQVRSFAMAGRFSEVVAALAVMSGLSVPFVERAMVQERADLIVLIAKALALSWTTAKTLLLLHARDRPVASATMGQSLAAFERISPSAAEEIVRFYCLRDQSGPSARQTS
jgi:uncharacterized protein (DUF2336 family)